MNIFLLIQEFKRIKKMGYIKAVNQNHNATGRTFEKMLGLYENNFRYSDYYGIEIKCFSSSQNSFFGLFSIEPESINGNVIKRIALKYGYADKKYDSCNILNTYVNGVAPKYISLKYKGLLYINTVSQSLNLLVLGKRNLLYDFSASWSFERLKDKFHCKCQTLAVVKAVTKKINGVLYIKYTSMTIYKFKGFLKFLEAIDAGSIRVSFKLTVSKREKELYYHNHGTTFEIDSQRMSDVYKIINKI